MQKGIELVHFDRPAQPTQVTASWIQRHRLGQIAHEIRSGSHNPYYDVWFVQLKGRLVIEALNEAWLDLQRRYPTLLCGFDVQGGVWKVGEPAEPCPVLVCSGEDERTAVEAAVRAPFDVASGPLCRFVVAQVRPEVHLAALVVEHLVCDAWSMDRLIADLGSLYLGHLAPKEGCELPPPGPSYSAFAQRENEYLASPQGLRDIAAALAAVEPLGVLPEVKIPAFTGRQDIDYTRQGRLVGRIEADEVTRLTLLGRKAGMRLPALLGAAMHLALAELSGAAHVGTPVVTSNRRRPEDFGVVGWVATKFVLTSQPLAYAGDDYLLHFRDRFYTALRSPAVSWQRLLFEQHPHVFGNFSSTPIVTFNVIDRSTGKRGSAFVGLSVEELPIRLGGRDNSIMADWAISEGVDVSIDFKSDWYSYDDINMLWSALRDIHRRWLSGE